MTLLTTEHEDIGEHITVFGEILPPVAEHLYLTDASYLKRFVLTRLRLIGPHVSLIAQEDVRFHDTRARGLRIGGRIVMEHSKTALADSIFQHGKVAVVLARELHLDGGTKPIEIVQLLFECHYIRRVLFHSIKQAEKEVSLVISKIHRLRDFLEERRMGIEAVEAMAVMHHKTIVFQLIDEVVDITGGGAHDGGQFCHVFLIDTGHGSDDIQATADNG